jgi:small-conductance mechanosensitive channel
MSEITDFLSNLKPSIPFLVTLTVVTGILVLTHWILDRRSAVRPSSDYRRQLIMVAATFFGLVLVILVSPLSENQEGQLLRLLGILLSGALALSSTTLLGNALAGLMLRAVRSFRMGDFVRVKDQFGRVSGRGLFHTEIQTPQRDLVTIPNLYLVTNPVQVVRQSGTIVSAEVSLGYDVPRERIESLLLQAAEAAELEDPFVHVIELKDFAVVYRISGLLTEVKHLLRARSRLREQMLDVLHGGGVEIVSPGFVNRREVGDRVFVPPVLVETEPLPQPEETSEAVAFDKAEAAAQEQSLEVRLDEANAEIEELEAQLKGAPEERKSALEAQLTSLRASRDRLVETIKRTSR